MTGKEALKIIKDSKSISFCEAYAEPLNAIEKDLDHLEELEQYACKYKSLISGNLWRDGKERTKWFNKIRNQKSWISCLSTLREIESNDEEQLLNVLNHLDTTVLYWALLSLEEKIKRYSEEKFEND